MAESNEYANNNFLGEDGLVKKDPLRLFDIGNDIQMGVSKLGAPTETERATSNFEKMTENKRRPFSHTLTDATRLLPDLITIGETAYKTGLFDKVIDMLSVRKNKNIKDVAKKLIHDEYIKLREQSNVRTPDVIQKELLHPDELRINAMKYGINAMKYGINEDKLEKALTQTDLYKGVMNSNDINYNFNRRRLTRRAKRENIVRRPALHKIYENIDNIDDISDVNILDAIKEDGRFRRLYSNELFKLDDELNSTKIGPKTAQQSKIELYKKYLKNDGAVYLNDVFGEELPAFEKRPYKNEMVTKSSLQKYKNANKDVNIKEDILKLIDISKDPLTLGGIKAISSNLNNFNESPITTTGEIKANYYRKGLQQEPSLNIMRSFLNMDYSDPARYNENEIEAYWQFLKDTGQIDPHLKNVTPRQKVSLIQGIVKDRPELIGRWKKEKSNYLNGEKK